MTTVNVGDFGTDGAAFNRAAATLVGTGGTLLIPGGSYDCEDTARVGGTDDANTAPASMINIVCPDGPDNTVFNWNGPRDGRPAFLLARNTHFQGGGFSVLDRTYQKTNIGVAFGGSGSKSFGNACNNSVLTLVMVGGFKVGLSGSANGGCGSEITCVNWAIGTNDVGVEFTDYNALNWRFVNLSMGDNRVGVRNGNSSTLVISGGSASNNEVDFESDQDSSFFRIEGFRSEGGKVFLRGAGGSATITDCEIKDGAGLDGRFKRLVLRGNEFEGGWINIDTNIVQMLSMYDNVVQIDPATNLPFIAAGAWDSVTKVRLWGNRGPWGSPWCRDGVFRISNSIIGEPPGPLVRPNIQIIDEQHRLDMPLSVSRPYGGSRLDLAGVRSLSQGVGGGRNFLLGAQFKGSNKCQVSFTRQMTVSGIGRPTHTITAAGAADNRFFTCDAGRPITLLGQGTAAGRKDWSGKIDRYNSPTSVNISSAVDQTLNFPAGVTAVIGEDELDANYDVWPSTNRTENIGVDNKTTAGFTLSSSNRSSTATVSCLIVGR